MPEVKIASSPVVEENNSNDLVMEWNERESNEHERGVAWHLSISLGALVIAGLLFWQKIYSGVFLVIIAALFVLFFSKNKNKLIRVSMYQKGIRIEDRTYRFSDIKEFAVGRVNGVLTIKFILGGGLFAGFVTAPVQEEYAEQVYTFLSERLPENHDNFNNIIDSLSSFFRK